MQKFLDNPTRSKARRKCGGGRVVELEKSDAMRRVDPALPPKLFAMAEDQKFRNLRVVPPQYEEKDDDFDKKQTACYGLTTPKVRREALELLVKKQRYEALYKKECGALMPRYEKDVAIPPSAQKKEEEKVVEKKSMLHQPPRLLSEGKQAKIDPDRLRSLRDRDGQGRDYNILTHTAVVVADTQSPYSTSIREHRRMLHPSQQSLERGRNLQGSL